MNVGDPRLFALGVGSRDTLKLNAPISQPVVDSTKVEVIMEKLEDLQLEEEAMERTIMARGEGPLES